MDKKHIRHFQGCNWARMSLRCFQKLWSSKSAVRCEAEAQIRIQKPKLKFIHMISIIKGAAIKNIWGKQQPRLHQTNLSLLEAQRQHHFRSQSSKKFH